jgi:hypothetical protein
MLVGLLVLNFCAKIYYFFFYIEMQKVEWSPDGNYYGLVSNKVVSVRDNVSFFFDFNEL